MKRANYGDPFSCKISIRLSKRQLSFVQNYSTSLNISPSNLFRGLIDNFIYSSDMEIEKDENEDANFNNQLQ